MTHRATPCPQPVRPENPIDPGRPDPHGVGGWLAGTLGRNLPVLAVLLVFASAMQRWIGPAGGPFASKMLLDIGIAVILAVSLNIVNGFTGQFSLGHAGFMAVGGYAAGAIVYYGSYAIWGDALAHGGGQWLFLAACLAGGVLAALVGLVVGLPSLRLRGDYLAIVTLGFGEIVRVLLRRTGGVLTSAGEIARASWPARLGHLGGSLGFVGLPFYTNLFWVYLFVGITVLAAWRLKLSSYGRAFLAIREDERAAEAMGVPVFKYKVRAFVLAAFFAGVAGGLYAHELGVTLNAGELGFMRSIEIVIMVVLGGMGSISGAVLAAVLLTALPEALRSFADSRMILYALILILIMLLRPQGLFGLHEVWDYAVWPRRWRGRWPGRSPGKGGERP